MDFLPIIQSDRGIQRTSTLRIITFYSSEEKNVSMIKTRRASSVGLDERSERKSGDAFQLTWIVGVRVQLLATLLSIAGETVRFQFIRRTFISTVRIKSLSALKARDDRHAFSSRRRSLTNLSIFQSNM